MAREVELPGLMLGGSCCCALEFRPIEWLNLNFASCVIHQTRSLGVLILYFIYNIVFVN